MIKHCAIFMFCLILTTLSPISSNHLFRLTAGQLIPAKLSGSILPVPQSTSGDLNQDGLPENLVLQYQRLTISQGNLALWASPADWTIQEAIIGDLNRDGSLEVVMLIWRIFKPWPIDKYIPVPGRIHEFQNSKGQSCQIILVGWQRGKFVERWAGSALAEPIRSFNIADLNQDGYEELITLDSRYSDIGIQPARSVSAWEWNGFGFTLINRITGCFIDATPILIAPGSTVIMTVP